MSVYTAGAGASVVVPGAGVGHPFPNILANLTSWWSFNGNGDDAHGSNHLTAAGTLAPTYVAGKVGNAADIEYGPEGHFEVASNASLQLVGGNFTIAGWYYVEGGATGYDTIIWKGNEYYIGALMAYAGTPYFNIAATGATYGGAALGLGTWRFIVCWYDRAAQLNYLQVDNGTVYVSPMPNVVSTVDTGPLWFGAHGGGQHFDGSVDEWGLWKGYILSAEERGYLWNGGAGRAYAELG